MPAHPTQRKAPSEIFPLLTVNFIDALGYSIILPFLVFIVQDFGGNGAVYGLVGAIYPFFQFFGAPILGNWSDRVGRKKILLLSQAGTFLSWTILLSAFFLPENSLLSVETKEYGLIALTIPLLVLMAARAFDGLTGGNISVANAYLSDITHDSDRKANFGKMAASMNLGFISGPLIAGVLASNPYGHQLTVVLAALISFVAIFIIYFFLPESKQVDKMNTSSSIRQNKKILHQEHKDCKSEKAHHKSNLSKVFSIDSVPLMIILYFGIFLSFNFFYATFPIYAADNLKWSPTQLGIFFTILSGVMIVVQGYLIPKLGNYFQENVIYTAGGILLAISFSLLTLSLPCYIYLAAVLFGIGNGMMWPSYLSLLSKLGTKKQQGTIQGYANSAGSIASILGLITGGFLFVSIGSHIFFVSAMGILTMAGFGLKLKRLSKLEQQD